MGTGGFVYRGNGGVKATRPSVGLAEKIRAISATLTPAERRIADVLSSSNMLTGLETIVKLAQRANVSGPSILRFTSKLGFDGFTAFQAAVSEDIQSRFTSSLEQHARASAHQREGIIKEALDAFHSGIERTLGRLDDAALNRVATLLADSRRSLYFIGGRLTRYLAETLWANLHQLRPRTQMFRSGALDVYDQLIELGRRDVLVVFDIRPYQSDTIEVAERAKNRGVHIILVTDTLLSPISRIATDVLTCDLDAPSGMNSLVPCLALVETVLASVRERLGESGQRRVVAIEALRDAPGDPIGPAKATGRG